MESNTYFHGPQNTGISVTGAVSTWHPASQ
jgi:hypothetical protein